jgi:hypothetical protein
MADDIELNIGINAAYLEASIKKVLERFEDLGGLKTKSLPKSLKSLPKSPFGAYAKEKTQIGKIHLDPLGKKKAEDPKIDLKNQFDSLIKWSRVFKIDLFWRWIKGTWNTITKYMPMLGKFSEIITAALTLIFTALLLPFLPGILEALKFLLDKSVAFFNWMKGMEGLSPSVMAEKIVADINKFFTETPWEEYGKIIGTNINNIVDFVDKFIKGINWETIGTSFGKFVNGVLDTFDGAKLGKTITDALNAGIEFFNSMFKEVDWVEFGTELGDAIVSALGSIDWQGLGELIGNAIVAVLKGLVGLIIGLGKGFDKHKLDLGPVAIAKLGIGIVDSLGKGVLGEDFGLPPTADGGIVTSPQARLVGEAGPEAIIPLDQMRNMGGTSITVSGLVDEYKFRSIIREEIEKSNRRLFNARGAVSI